VTLVPSSSRGSGGGGGTVTSVSAGDTSIVVGGTATDPTIETGTLDKVANLHPPVANWSNNAKKITAIANGSAAQDAAAFGQIPTTFVAGVTAGDTSIVVGGTMPTANRATFARVYVPAAFVVTSIGVQITVSSGNVDFGIYSESAGAPNARLWSLGGVASPGTGMRSFLISAGTPNTLTLTPGVYWLAAAADNAVITWGQINGNGTFPDGLLAFQGTSYPLPASVSTATTGGGGTPIMILQ